MRASATSFFYAGTGDLVEGDPDELILNCYRLAERFHQPPDVFLSMPRADIDRHIKYTVKLQRLQLEAAQRAAEEY